MSNSSSYQHHHHQQLHYHHHYHHHHHRTDEISSEMSVQRITSAGSTLAPAYSSTSTSQPYNDHHHEANELASDNKNNRTTEAQTMMHILKANIGTGVLAMPLAFKNVGLWLGLALVPLIGAICIHCMNILIGAHNNLCDRFNYESLDYDQVAALGLACGPRWARRLAKRTSFIVTVFLMFTQLGFCCVYILFTVENLQVACMNLFGLNYSMLTYLLVIFPIIGLTSCTSNLKHLARISTLANILQSAGLALIFYDLLQFHTYVIASDDGITSLADGENNDNNNVDVIQQHHSTPPAIVVDQGISLNILSGLPLFFATAVYAFEGIGVVLPLVKEMEHPGRIAGPNGVLNTSMSMVALLYMAMGFFGYSKYGQIVAGSITLNLPQTTLNELVRLAFAIAIGLSYSLQFYVPWTVVWPLIDESLFYSYRPRVPRNKLSILNKLSAENHWALQRVLEEEEVLEAERQQRKSSAFNGEAGDESGQAVERSHWLQYNDNSTATTFATSYSMSLSVAAHNQQQQQQQPPRLLLNQQQQQKSLGKSMSLSGQLSAPTSAPTTTAIKQPLSSGQGCQYGALAGASLDGAEKVAVGSARTTATATATATAAAATTTASSQQQQHHGRRRNRLEDVMEQSSDEMPEVQWRPPPRSMRGKRKLVRYTVILLTVSLTFVAAALIPRLDLFISLIGALASSSLAIIFPAIIQLCTFWNNAHNQSGQCGQCGNNNGGHCDGHRDDDDDDDASAGKRNNHQPDAPELEQQSSPAACCCRQNRPSNSKLGASTQLLLPNCRDCKRRRRRRWQHSIAWHLFVLKNMFLVLFGVLGLITGTWVSLKQLMATGAAQV